MKYLLGAFFCLFEHGPVETKFRTNSLQLRFDCKNISEFRGSANGCLGLRAQVYVLSHLNDDFVHYSKPTQWRASFKNVLPDFCVCLFVCFVLLLTLGPVTRWRGGQTKRCNIGYQRLLVSGEQGYK